MSFYIVFFSVVAVVYFLVSFYIFKRSYSVIKTFPGFIKKIYPYLFLFFFLSYPFARIFKNYIFEWIGSFYVCYFLYGFVILLILEIVRFFNRFFHFIPQSWRENKIKVKKILFSGFFIFFTLLFMGSWWNAQNPVFRNLEFKIEKKSSLNELKIVFFSDVHLNQMTRKNAYKDFVLKVNAEKPDLIILGGDVIDRNADEVWQNQSGEWLKDLNAKYGVYAVTGNHEYYSGIEKSIDFLKQHKITVLEDRWVKIADAVYLAGRKDNFVERFGGKRKSLDKILRKQGEYHDPTRLIIPDKSGRDTGLDPINFSLPVILIDHQPKNLSEAEKEGVDLQLSGHTHNGQIFPGNFLTSMLYETSYGYLKKGKTQYFISAGLGTALIPIRLGNRPEVLVIRLTFEK